MFEQERVIGRLQRRIAADPAIVGCFLGGSFGRRAEDDYSDIDVALIFADDAARDRAWHERNEFARSVMPYVPLKAFDGEHVRPYLYITLFSNGSKIDYRYESAVSLAPNPWDGQIRILKDSDGWAEQFQADSARLSKPQAAMSSAELTRLDQRFWVMYWDALRLLSRGDHDKPFTIYLEILYFTLPPLLAALPVDDAAHEGLIGAYFSRDTVETAKQLQGLLDAYVAARSAVIRRYHLQPMGDQAFESEIGRLIQKLT
ncbi:MAG: nucleotidyltransferase domain-containing protein [Chloroflexota bacterium]